ncbi:MAG: hypothetical protein MUE44_07540 [Oscillatoriaceae cyanobacterium Prado104]|nr:hypothetical protein [Oscillatoriaceae cyanobacterium Prado104]
MRFFHLLASPGVDDRLPLILVHSVTKPEGILQYLLQLGIVENRADGRINMPEIYLYGFQVKRKDGVKRPKRGIIPNRG